MKKFLLFAAIAVLTACSVEDDLDLYKSEINDVNVTYADDNCTVTAGDDKSRWIEISEAEAIPSWDEVRKLYINMLDPMISRTGTFQPNISSIISQFNAQGLGDLSTVYTVTEGECSDSVVLTITVVPDGYEEPTCEITAGEDNSITITEAEASALPSWDEVRKLFLNLLSPGVDRNGTFDPGISAIIDSYTGVGEYSTVYTVGEGNCTDSATLTVIVVPNCEADAGEDNTITITEEEASALPSWDEVRKLYLNLLSEGVRRDGTFDPNISAIINAYSGVGEYSTVYTVGEGDCTDSVTLTVIVVEGQSTPPCDISAGPDNMRTITESQAAAIPSWDEVRKLYINLLGPGVPRNGTFDPSITDIINDFQARRTGDFSTTYTVTNGECSDTVLLTIRVIPD